MARIKVNEELQSPRIIFITSSTSSCCCNTFTTASHKHLTDAELYFTTISQAVLPTTPVYKLGFTVRL
jgi:hypothetical protein